MTALIILGCVLGVLVLISLLRVGGTAEYSGAGLVVRLKIGPVQRTAYPAKAKKGKGGTKKKSQPNVAEEERQPGGNFERFRQYLPVVAQAAGRLKRKVRVDTLHLDFTAAAQDPAAAAMEFGCANVAIGMLFPLLEHNFNIKDRRIRTAVDFNAKQPVIYLLATFSMTVGQGAALGLWLFLAMLKHSSAQREKQKEAV